MAPSALRRPPYSADVATALSVMYPDGVAPAFPLEAIPTIRETLPSEDVSGFEGTRRDFTIAGYRGDQIDVSVFTPDGVNAPAPAIFTAHGGGMIFGDRFSGMSSLVLPMATRHGLIAVTVEYRLAPEFPHPYPLEDSYAALVWMAENTVSLGIDPARLLLVGGSAGGGLAAGMALLARDRGGPELRGQLLLYPMLDDRDVTVSTHQYDGIGVWDRSNNITGWTALLGDRRATDDVSPYAAPARATDLSGLAPTFIDAGSAEVFRDECVAFASQLWADGCDAELHIWPGGTHGWEVLAPTSALARLAAEARDTWVKRVLLD